MSSNALAHLAPHAQAITDSGFTIIKVSSLTASPADISPARLSRSAERRVWQLPIPWEDSASTAFRLARRRIDVYHVTLDELGLGLVTPKMELRPSRFGGGGAGFSVGSEHGQDYMSSHDRAVSPAAVLDRCSTPRRRRRLQRARDSRMVRVRRQEEEVRTSLEHRDVTTASDGRFRICGFPSEFIAGLSASFAGDTTTKIAIRLIASWRRQRFVPCGTMRAQRTSARRWLEYPPRHRRSARWSIAGRMIDPRGSR